MDPHIQATTEQVLRRHPGLSAATVEAWVVAEFEARDDSRVRQFLSILVTRAVEERIRYELRPRGRAADDRRPRPTGDGAGYAQAG